MNKIVWNKVTWYSKLLALALFVALPFIGFYYGMKYGRLMAYLDMASEIQGPSAIGRRCGGFIRNAPTCPTGYFCKLGRIPDAGGTCQPQP